MTVYKKGGFVTVRVPVRETGSGSFFEGDFLPGHKLYDNTRSLRQVEIIHYEPPPLKAEVGQVFKFKNTLDLVLFKVKYVDPDNDTWYGEQSHPNNPNYKNSPCYIHGHNKNDWEPYHKLKGIP